jgi:two-component system, NarL family, response regulator DegU
MPSAQDRIRIVIVDDHPLFREGLRQVIQSDKRFDLVGEAEQGKAALELILRTKPDLAVLDIHLPLMNGLEVAAALQARKSSTRLVILTMLRDEAAFQQAMNLGIQGYVLKENAVSEILNCLLAVASDTAFVSPSLSGYLLPRYRRAVALTHAQPRLKDLTAAQRLILRRIADKKTSKEIAAELSISPRTVESHRATICSRLSLKGTNSLLQFALENRSALLDLSHEEAAPKSSRGRSRP